MDEASARKMLARLDTEPECRAYIRGVMKTIALPLFDETKIAHDTMIVVRFTLHQDGHVSDTAVSGATNSPASPLCIRAITDHSPFPKWPSQMRPVVGEDHFEIYYHFGFNMTPPGPN